VICSTTRSVVQRARAVGGFTAAVGDARALDQADGSVDATPLLGPLYHLVDAADRAQALREARRVTRAGGLVVAAGISRYAGLLEYGNNGRFSEDNQHLFTDALATGRHYDDPNGFTNAYFHHADELRAEFESAGFEDVDVLGVEGPAAPALDNASPDDVPRLLPAAITLARLVERDPRMMSASVHFLAFGRCQGIKRGRGPGRG
jgi:SAM-dependent methyltransferase